MSVIKFDPQIKTIKWMIEMIDNNSAILFNGDSQIYQDFWQAYVDLEGIELPYEMDIPYKEEYFLSELKDKEDFSDWYRRRYKDFCVKIKEVRGLLVDYMERG